MLLAAGRVVNLAVPILYKRVVDRLSYATNVSHPQARRPGDLRSQTCVSMRQHSGSAFCSVSHTTYVIGRTALWESHPGFHFRSAV